MTFISSFPILTKQFKKVNTFKIYTNYIDKIIFLFYFPFITKKSYIYKQNIGIKMNVLNQAHEAYRNRKGRKLKSNRKEVQIYESLLRQAEELGVLSIRFDNHLSYRRRIEVLKNIIQLETSR